MLDPFDLLKHWSRLNRHAPDHGLLNDHPGDGLGHGTSLRSEQAEQDGHKPEEAQRSHKRPAIAATASQRSLE
jgi:hypothetical protein